MRILSGMYKNRLLKTPKGNKTRPTSSKLKTTLFDILQDRIDNARFLDLFSGSGSIGIEALSRGAKEAVFVEKDPQAASILRENLATLQIKAPLFQLDVYRAIKKLIKQGALFDLIFIDPPYSLDVSPLLEELPKLLSEEGMVIVEQGKRANLEISALKLHDRRDYGDTSFFFFIKPWKY